MNNIEFISAGAGSGKTYKLTETLAQALHARTGAFRPHRLAQLVGLGRREPSNVDGHLHELFLKERHAECLGERVLEQRVQVRDRLEAVATPDVRGERWSSTATSASLSRYSPGMTFAT